MSRKSILTITFCIQTLFLFVLSFSFLTMFQAPSGAGWGAMFLIIPLLFVNSIFHLILTVLGFFARTWFLRLSRLFLLIMGILLIFLTSKSFVKVDYFLVFYVPIYSIFWLLDLIEISDPKVGTNLL